MHTSSNINKKKLDIDADKPVVASVTWLFRGSCSQCLFHLFQGLKRNKKHVTLVTLVMLEGSRESVSRTLVTHVTRVRASGVKQYLLNLYPVSLPGAHAVLALFARSGSAVSIVYQLWSLVSQNFVRPDCGSRLHLSYAPGTQSWISSRSRGTERRCRVAKVRTRRIQASTDVRKFAFGR